MSCSTARSHRPRRRRCWTTTPNSAELFVDKDLNIAGGCRGQSADGLKWTCYVGQRAVDEADPRRRPARPVLALARARLITRRLVDVDVVNDLVDGRDVGGDESHGFVAHRAHALRHGECA